MVNVEDIDRATAERQKSREYCVDDICRYEEDEDTPPFMTSLSRHGVRMYHQNRIDAEKAEMLYIVPHLILKREVICCGNVPGQVCNVHCQPRDKGSDSPSSERTKGWHVQNGQQCHLTGRESP
jgi:hypothetical protein